MGALVDGVTRAWVMAFGRRGSVFVSVCLSQDGRNINMLRLSQYVYIRLDSVAQLVECFSSFCTLGNVIYA